MNINALVLGFYADGIREREWPADVPDDAGTKHEAGGSGSHDADAAAAAGDVPPGLENADNADSAFFSFDESKIQSIKIMNMTRK